MKKIFERLASGEYEDFMTGFVVDNGHAWGRPVGVAVAPDGSLLVSDHGSESSWRISYTVNSEDSSLQIALLRLPGFIQQLN